MKQFKKILLCVHPEYTDLGIIDRTAKMAAKSGAMVKVMHVVSDYPEDVREWWNVRNPEKLHAKIVKERTDFLQGIADRVRQAGVEQVETKLAWGKPFLAACHEVMTNGHDLVIVTSRNLGRLARMTHECPSLQLFHYCPCAVWINKGKPVKRCKRIAAALASERGEVPISGLNAKILDHAASIVALEGSELHIVHAMPVYGGKGIKGKRLRADLVDYLEAMRNKIRDEVAAYLGDSVPELGEQQIHLLPGQPASVIPDFIPDHCVDLIVMGTVGRTGIPALVIGNTAEKVFSQVDCGVLAVKPDNFVSLVSREMQ